jgi:hypothetical protein
MLPGTRLWAYTGRGEPFSLKLAYMQRQGCFLRLASGLTKEEDSLSASSLLLCRGRNVAQDSPLGFNRKRTDFLLQACVSAEAGCLDPPMGLNRKMTAFLFKLAFLQMQECFPGLASGV